MSKSNHSTNRKIEQDYYDLASARGFEWLGPYPQNTNKKTAWQCSKGHVWYVSYQEIKGCPHCSKGGLAHKKTPQDYRKLAASRGFTWLGPYPGRVSAKSKWQCANGHIWDGRYDAIVKGVGCPYCAHNLQKTEDDYLAIAKERGFTWLGPLPAKASHRTQWKCEFGHIWSASYRGVGGNKKTGCPHCAGNALKTPEDYNKLAQEHSFIWLGPLPERASAKTKWMCPKGHICEMSFANIRAGNGCWQCSGRMPITPDEYQQIADERNIIWLGPYPSNVEGKTTWQCQQGHTWQSTYTLVRIGHGCPHCARVAKKTPQDYHDLAAQVGIEWLGPEVPNTSIRTRWRCPDGHEWETSYNPILRGTRCPHCRNMVNGVFVSRPQIQLAEMLSGELNKRVGRYVVDIALEIDGTNLAVEYDCWYWHIGKEEKDARRDAYLIKRGWRVLHVKAEKALPSLDQLNAAIARLLTGETYAEIILPDWKG